jgi:hypothetical protein
MITAVTLGVLTMVPLAIGVAFCIYDTIKVMKED